MNFQKIFLSLALLVFSKNLLPAATWHVAPTGNDNAAGSQAAPFRTIPRAIEAASAGDVILLRGGTHKSEEIRITKNNLTLRSFPGEWAIIAAPLDVEDISSCIWYSEPSVEGGLLENLEITGGYFYGVSFETDWDWGVPMAQRHGASRITLRGCKIHDTGRDAIKIKPRCDGIQILNCEIFNTGVGPSNSPANGGPNAEGIDNVNGDGMVVRNCHIHNISTTGVYAKGGAKDCIIEENLIYSTQEAGILLGFYTDAEFFDVDGTNPQMYECQYSLARNNIVYNTGGAGIGFFAARNCSAYNNTVATASGNFHAPLYFSPGEIWVDDNTTLTPPNFNLLVFNNIFVDKSGTGDEDWTVQIREGAMSGTNSVDKNIYQKTSGAASFDDGVSWPGLNFSQWKTKMGFDAASQEINPKLDGNFHLQTGSPAIDAGKTSPAARDYDGKNRTGTPDIGADEFGNGAILQVPPPAGTIGTGATGGSIPTFEIADDEPVFEIFPNPTTDKIFLKNAPAPVRLTLFDAFGNQMKTVFDSEISVRELPAGAYFLEILGRRQVFFKI